MANLVHESGVAALLFNPNNPAEFLTLYSVKKGKWGIPTGTIEGNDDPKETLFRELEEELGITATKAERLTTLVFESKSLSGIKTRYRTYVYLVKDWAGHITNAESHNHAFLEFRNRTFFENRRDVNRSLCWVLKQPLTQVKVSVESGKSKLYKPQEHDKHPGWYKVPGYPYFLASKDGQVMNAKTGYKTKGSKDDRGYRRCCVWDNAKKAKKDIKVHRVICTAFHGPAPGKGYEVGHKNDIRDDNRASNLYWTTRKANMKKMFKRVSMESFVGESGYFAITSTDVKKGFVNYPVVRGFKHKAIHKSLTGLRKFIKTTYKDLDGWFYVKVDMGDFIVDIESSDMEAWSVKLPFRFDLKDKVVIPLSDADKASMEHARLARAIKASKPLSLNW